MTNDTLLRMFNHVVAAGGHHILVTPLSRCKYPSDGTIDGILELWAVYVREAVLETNQRFIELLHTSITYLKKVERAAAMRLNYTSNNYTYLKADGKVIFERMVADLVKAKNTVTPNPFTTHTALSGRWMARNFS